MKNKFFKKIKILQTLKKKIKQARFAVIDTGLCNQDLAWLPITAAKFLQGGTSSGERGRDDTSHLDCDAKGILELCRVATLIFQIILTRHSNQRIPSSNHWSGAKGPRIQHLLAPHVILPSVGASGLGRSLPLRVRGGFTQASLDSSPAVLMLRGIFRKESFLLVPRLWAFFEHYLLRGLQMYFSLCCMV